MPHQNNLSGNAKSFFEACCDNNSIEELIDCDQSFNADQGDCETWEITESEWFDATNAAAAEKIRWWVSDNECQEFLQAIAEWENCDVDDVYITGEGDIAVSNKYFDSDRLIAFYLWFVDVYGGNDEKR